MAGSTWKDALRLPGTMLRQRRRILANVLTCMALVYMTLSLSTQYRTATGPALVDKRKGQSNFCEITCKCKNVI